MNQESDKDYYQLLNLASTASVSEIKKAFRKMAMRYHPDKNPGNPKAAEKFSQIQKAYLVLSDSKLRAAYHLQRYPGKQKNIFTIPVADTAALLSLAEKLHKQVSQQDPFRTDRDQLYFSITSLLSDEHVKLLAEENHASVMGSLLTYLLPAVAHLSFPLIKDISEKLNPLVQQHPEARQQLQKFMRSAGQLYLWHRYKMIIALLLTLLSCVLFYLSVKR
jgi:molecular chaperone DnaJ